MPYKQQLSYSRNNNSKGLPRACKAPACSGHFTRMDLFHLHIHPSTVLYLFYG